MQRDDCRVLLVDSISFYLTVVSIWPIKNVSEHEHRSFAHFNEGLAERYRFFSTAQLRGETGLGQESTWPELS